ncbi:MAG: hypothetical protein ACYDC7_12150, partial [Acidithiobacillus ferrivorans]
MLAVAACGLPEWLWNGTIPTIPARVKPRGCRFPARISGGLAVALTSGPSPAQEAPSWIYVANWKKSVNAPVAPSAGCKARTAP